MASWSQRIKSALVAALLPKAYAWARAANPKQPLTSGVWTGDFSRSEKLNAMERTQLDMSDVISFHNYSAPDEFEKESSCCSVSSSDALHRIHGARQQEHVRGDSADCEEV